MAGDVEVAVVSGAIPTTGGGTADFTKSGFGTPKTCLIIVTWDTSDDANVTAESRASIGFSDFTNDFHITHQDEDASAKVDCDALKSNGDCYSLLLVSGSQDVRGSAATITDGVRLTNRSTPTPSGQAALATVIMFGGADLNVSLVRTAIASSQDGTATIAHSGFTDGNDKLIFFIGTDIGAEDSANSGINNSFGVCHATGSDAGGWTFVQRCIGWASDHNNVAGSPSTIISTDRVLDIITETGGQDWGLEVTNLDHSPAEWTVTTRDAGSGSGMEVYSLALDLDDRKAKVGSVDSPTSGATWTPSVSLGFTPQYVGLGLTRLGSEDTISSSGVAGSMGISSNTGSGEETCHTWYNVDLVGTTNTNNLFRSRVIDYRTSDVTAVIQDHSHSSFNSGDWTYTINTENETAARKWFYWAIEEVAAGAHTGTGAPTFEPFTMTAVGEQPHEGVGAPDFEAMSLTAVGVAGEVGAGVLPLEVFELTAVGEQPHEGTGAPDFEAMVLTAAGVQKLLATGAPTFEAMVLTASGVQKLLSTGAPNFEAMVLTASGIMLPAGVGTLPFQEFVMTAVGQVPFEGVTAAELEQFVLVAVGEQPHTAAGTPTLGAMTLVAVGIAGEVATGAPTFEVFVLTVAGTAAAPEGTGAPTFEIFTMTAAGVMVPAGIGNLVMQPMVLTAVGVGGAAAVIKQLIRGFTRNVGRLMNP